MHILSIFLSAVALLLLFFSVHLLITGKGHATLNRLLSLAFLSRFWQVGVLLVIISPYPLALPAVQKINTLFFFVAPACTYLYVRYFINDEKRFQKKHLLHFLPAILGIFHILPIPVGAPVDWSSIARQILAGGQLSLSEKTGLVPPQVYKATLVLLWIGYLAAMWQFIARSGVLKRRWKTGKRWILFFVVMSSFFRLLTFVALAFNALDHSFSQSPVFLTVSSAALLFMVAFVLYQPQILYGYIIVSDPVRKDTTEEDSTESIKQNGISAVRKNLDTAQQQTYQTALESYMREGRPFLDPDFQMKDLAKALDIPAHHCSFVINHHIGKNFRDWINSYRVQHFVNVYPDMANKMTVEAVAQQSGFKSTATFYNAFKKETGQMPTAYFSAS